MSVLLLALVANLLLVFTFGVEDAHACSCVRSSSEEQLQRSDAVFLGEVVSVREDSPPLPEDGPPLGGPIIFDVEESWKGVPEEQVTVRGDGPGPSCLLETQKGERYLVYARYGKEDGPLETNVCDWTKPLVHAQDELRALGAAETTLPETGAPVPVSGTWHVTTTGVVAAIVLPLLALAGAVVLLFRVRRRNT